MSPATIAVRPKAGMMCNWGQMPGNGARVRTGLTVAFPVTCVPGLHTCWLRVGAAEPERTSPMLRCAAGGRAAQLPNERLRAPSGQPPPHEVGLSQ